MSLELWNTVFAGATFVVIAATAVAALIQLRHLRSSNQLAAHLALMEMWNADELRRHIHYLRTELPDKLKDPAFLAALAAGDTSRQAHPEFVAADFWEQTGALMKYGLLDENAWLDLSSSQLARSWEMMEPIIEVVRAKSGPAAFENFEYAAVRARLWSQRHPDGAYPKDVPRMRDLKARDARGG